MKKSIIITVISLLTILAYGNPKKKSVSPEMRHFEKIISLPNQTKEALYTKINIWFAETFHDAKTVIEFQDEEAGKIMGNYFFTYSIGTRYKGYIKQAISIDIKDQKVRIKISDPYLKRNGSTARGPKGAIQNYTPLTKYKDFQRANTQWEELATSLNTFLAKDDTNW